MDLFVAGQDQSAADRPNNLAEGPPPIVTIVYCTSTTVRSLLMLVLVCVFLSLLLLIFGWLPHHCPLPKLGPFTQISLVCLCYTLI